MCDIKSRVGKGNPSLMPHYKNVQTKCGKVLYLTTSMGSDKKDSCSERNVSAIRPIFPCHRLTCSVDAERHRNPMHIPCLHFPPF